MSWACAFNIHKWTQWVVVDTVKIVDGNDCHIKTVRLQRRKCVVCGTEREKYVPVDKRGV